MRYKTAVASAFKLAEELEAYVLWVDRARDVWVDPERHGYSPDDWLAKVIGGDRGSEGWIISVG